MNQAARAHVPSGVFFGVAMLLIAAIVLVPAPPVVYAGFALLGTVLAVVWTVQAIRSPR
jgi:hypothetical protein